jgi:catenin beta 1
LYIEELGSFDFVYNQPSVDEMNLNQTRSQRIRAAMFPESLEDYGFNAQHQQQPLNGIKPSALQRLAQPTQQLKTAILHLINYQEDADVTIKAIPELLKLLADEDKSVVIKTLKLIEQLSRKDASRFALASSQQLINALISLILNTNDLELHNSCAIILNNLSHHNNKQALVCIFKSGGIPALIKLLSSPIESVVYYAMTTLHSLLMYEPSAKVQVHHYNGTRKMIELLSLNNNVKFLAFVVDSLHILAFNNSEVKLVIQTSGGPGELVRIMRSSNYHKLIWVCVRLMKVLSVCPENKRVLVESGAMHVLSVYLINGGAANDERIMYNSLLTLRNLSDCAIREDNLDNLIKYLIDLLATNNDINVSTCAAGILSNLTCNNDMNKMKFVEHNGIEIILRTMLQAGPENKEDICEPAVCTLRHVTNRHPQAQAAQESVRFYYGLPVIAPLLQSDQSRWPLLKATIGLIRNLALSDNNLAPLRELGIIPRLVQLLIKAINAHQQAQQSGLENAIIDDVPMEEIIEGTVGALHQLARDSHNGVVIRELKCIPVLVQLLFMPWESIQRVACGCLSELAIDRQNAELIENERITDKLTELLRSKDHALSTYAAAVLFRLSDDKNENWNGSNVNYAMNNESIYNTNPNAAHRLNNIGSNDQYVSYNTIDPYELELQQPNHYNQMSTQLIDVPPMIPTNSNQPPATWFDTDL